MWFHEYIIILALLLFLSKQRVSGQKVSYACLFSDIVRDCEDFDNDLMDFKVSITPSGIDTSLCGTVTVSEDITQDQNLKVEMFRDVDGVLQYIGSNVIEFCKDLGDIDSAWYPFTNAMGVQNCPLKKGTYETCDVVIDLSRLDTYMTAEYCGEYSVIFKLLKPADPMGVPSMPSKVSADEKDLFEVKSCHEVYVNVLEYNQE